MLIHVIIIFFISGNCSKKQLGRKKGRKAGRQAGREGGRQGGRQAGRQADRQMRCGASFAGTRRGRE